MNNTISKRNNYELEANKRIILFLVSLTLVLTILVIITKPIKSIASDDSHVVNYKYYTSIQIESGDTLWSIAQEYIDYSEYESINDYINEVKDINSLKGNLIKSGNYLIIPYYSTEFKQG